MLMNKVIHDNTTAAGWDGCKQVVAVTSYLAQVRKNSTTQH